MDFSRSESPSPWDLPNPGIEPGSPAVTCGRQQTVCPVKSWVPGTMSISGSLEHLHRWHHVCWFEIQIPGYHIQRFWYRRLEWNSVTCLWKTHIGDPTSYAQSLSHVQLFVTPLTTAHQVLLSMDFSRQEYWGGLPFPSPGDLPNPGIEPASPVSLALAGEFFYNSWEARWFWWSPNYWIVDSWILRVWRMEDPCVRW